MSKQYKIEESNGIWYVQQFDNCRRLTAHAKLDTIRQLALWIEEQENYEKHAEDHRNTCEPDNNDDSRDIKWYRFSSGHVVPGQITGEANQKTEN